LTAPQNISAPSDGFFANLPKISLAARALEGHDYYPAPDDWHLIATDVRDSTSAVAGGKHKTVNFVAACSIAALKNACSPVPIPFLFGGDGATIMVPRNFREQARRILARLRRFIKTEYGLDLVVGCVQIADVRRNGADVRVGRYEPTPGNHFGVFMGGGVSLLEKSIKGRGDANLQRLSEVAEDLDDGGDIDLTGLSCRWDQLRSERGKILSVIVLGKDDELREVYDRIQRLATNGDDALPLLQASLQLKWPPPGYQLEAKARRKRGPLWIMTARVLAETLIAHVIITSSMTIGAFNTKRYKGELIANTDFCRYDDGLFFVVDSAAASIAEIARYLTGKSEQGLVRFGLHVSDAALMTCLVTSTSDSLHVHFVDGANGGYTRASEVLKGRIRLEQAIG